MSHIVIIGAGIIGAAIAYELSLISGLKITLIDENLPASGATGAALGVLMGIISHKTKGRGWKLRQTSLQRYGTLIPELEAITGEKIPVNRQGILMLRLAEDPKERWEKLISIRQDQGYQLELWELEKLQQYCPQIAHSSIMGAIYSPQDWQINPTILTQALVTGAARNGVNCQFGLKVQNIVSTAPDDANIRQCYQLHTTEGSLTMDALVIAAGLGATPLTTHLHQPLDIRPVLGQGMQVKLEKPLGNRDFQPVITGDDVHIVPLENGHYWIGATVEFPNEQGEVISQPDLLEKVRQQAIAFCPELNNAEVIKTWFGKRPRPQGEPAPIIRQLPGYHNIWLAAGHYRNGVLLAPATALAIREMFETKL